MTKDRKHETGNRELKTQLGGRRKEVVGFECPVLGVQFYGVREKEGRKEEIKNQGRKEPLRFINKNGMPIYEAGTLEELVNAVHLMDHETLEFYSQKDGFSTWLMRKGYAELADELRPIYGKGEELRKRLLEIVGRWLQMPLEPSGMCGRFLS